DSISEPGVYQAIVKAKLGITTVNNYGVSGTYVSKRDESDTTAMCTRISSMAGGADLNTVYGGINDFIGSYGGGDLGDISSTALTTFYGALKSIAVYLLTNYPTATNVFITPIKCGGYVSGVTGLTWYYDTPNAGGHVLADYANAIKEVGAKYSIPVLDLFSLSGIETTNINYMTSDKLHPGTIGYQRIATLMANFFSSLG
ncbi:MAG: SGNH/GDSL hydrolase family protein, partial [Bacillota bacterium]